MTTSPGTLTQITSTVAKDGDSDKMEIGTTLPEGVCVITVALYFRFVPPFKIHFHSSIILSFLSSFFPPLSSFFPLLLSFLHYPLYSFFTLLFLISFLLYVLFFHLILFPPGIVSWRSDLSTDEELSGLSTANAGTGMITWISEPMSGLNKKDNQPESPSSNWADFSSAFAKDSIRTDLE